MARGGIKTDMNNRGIGADVVTFTALAKYFSEVGDIVNFQKSLKEMRLCGIKPDLHFYNILINSLSTKEQIHEAIQLFEEIKAIGLKPDEHTVMSMLNCFNSSLKSDFTEALGNFLEYLKQINFTLNAHHYSLLMKHYSSIGDYTLCDQYYKELITNKFVPTDRTFTSVLKSIQVSKRYHLVNDYLEDMEKFSVPWNRFHCDVILRIYVDMKSHSNVIKVCEMLRKNQFIISPNTLYALVKFFTEREDLPAARDIILYNFQANERKKNISDMIDALQEYAKIYDNSEIIRDLYNRIEQQQPSKTPIYYNSILLAKTRCNEFDTLIPTMKEMKYRNIKFNVHTLSFILCGVQSTDQTQLLFSLFNFISELIYIPQKTLEIMISRATDPELSQFLADKLFELYGVRRNGPNKINKKTD